MEKYACKKRSANIVFLMIVEKTLETLEKVKKKEENASLNSVKEQLADSCKKCSMLQVLDMDKQKLYCPYLVKKECLIGSYIKKEKKDD